MKFAIYIHVLLGLFIQPTFPDATDILLDIVGFKDREFAQVGVNEHRKKELESTQQEYNKVFLLNKQEKLKKLADERAEVLTHKNRVINNQNRSEVVSLSDDVLALIKDQVDLLGSHEVLWEEYLAFLQEYNQILSDKNVHEYHRQIEQKSTYLISDLQRIEAECFALHEKRDSIERRKSTIELSRQEEESGLELSRKELKKLKQVDTAGRTDLLVARDFEQKMLDHRIQLSELKIDKLKFQNMMYARQVEYINLQCKIYFEPALKAIKQKIFVDEKTIASLKQEVEIVEKENGQVREELSRRLEKIKDSKNQSLKRQDELRRKQRFLREKYQAEEDVTPQSKIEQSLLDAQVLAIKFEVLFLDQELQKCLAKKRSLDVELDKKRCELTRAKLFNDLQNGQTKEFSSTLATIKEMITVDLAKSIERCALSLVELDSSVQQVNVAERAELKTCRDDVISKKQTLFRDRRDMLQLIFAEFDKAEMFVDQAMKTANEYRYEVTFLEKNKRKIRERYINLKAEMEVLNGVKNLWVRSPIAIGMDSLMYAFADAETFFKKIFWQTPDKLNPLAMLTALRGVGFSWWIGLFLFLLLFFVLQFVSRRLIKVMRDRINYRILLHGGDAEPRLLTLMSAFLGFVYENLFYIFSWLYIHLAIKWHFSIFSFSLNDFDGYYIAAFYLLSIPVLFVLVSTFIHHFAVFNQKMSYLFFSEKTSIKNILLLACLCYAGVVIYPLRCAIFYYKRNYMSSDLLSFLVAAYFFIAEIVILLFLEKDDVIDFLASCGKWFESIRRYVELIYYPLFFFIMGVLILCNPYVGYTNLAWFLLFAVPASILVLFLSYLIHNSVIGWLKETLIRDEVDEGESVGKIEHARLIYGLGFLFSLLFFSLFSFALISKFWTGNYNVISLWRNLSETWTLPIGDKDCFGVIQVLILITFVFGGYAFYYLIDRFLFLQIFEVFQFDTGLQNTISRMFQYLAIIFSLILGLFAIKLMTLLHTTVVGLGIAFMLGAKDQIADLFAGILILLERQVEIGHFVELEGGLRGVVHKISLRSTTIRTERNFFVSVPNKLLLSNPVSNWGSGRVAVGLQMIVPVDYGVDPNLVCDLIRKVLYDQPLILRVPTVVVRLENFTQIGMEFLARGFLNARRVREQWMVASAIRIELLRVFKENNITIPYRHTVVHFAPPSGKVDESVQISFDQDFVKTDE